MVRENVAPSASQPREQEVRHTCTKEDIVAQDQSSASSRQRMLADQERLSEALRTRLDGVFNRKAQYRAVC